MKFVRRTRVIWDVDGKEFFTEVERTHNIHHSIRERVEMAQQDAMKHLRLARDQAKMMEPNARYMEYYVVRENGETKLSATPLYVLGTFGKALYRGA